MSSVEVAFDFMADPAQVAFVNALPRNLPGGVEGVLAELLELPLPNPLDTIDPGNPEAISTRVAIVSHQRGWETGVMLGRVLAVGFEAHERWCSTQPGMPLSERRPFAECVADVMAEGKGAAAYADVREVIARLQH